VRSPFLAARFAKTELSERQRHIFLALLELHRRTSQPVGSDALSRMPGVRWSPAGIRSTLAELESLGMLHRGHASAGRLPTPVGYAFHVRREVEPARLPGEVLREVDERLRRASRDVEALLAEASRLLSELTFQMGLAVAAAFEQERLVHLELQPLGPRRALMALGLGGGLVHTVVLPLESELAEDDLEAAADALRSRLLESDARSGEDGSGDRSRAGGRRGGAHRLARGDRQLGTHRRRVVQRRRGRESRPSRSSPTGSAWLPAARVVERASARSPLMVETVEDTRRFEWRWIRTARWRD
jgi:hypothetical protein